MNTVKKITIAAALTMALAGCTDPYDPGQRALGGAAIGAGGGALLGGALGGGRGALTGALLGGAVGAVGGAATTPRPPPQGYNDRGYDDGRGYQPRGGPYQY